MLDREAVERPAPKLFCELAQSHTIRILGGPSKTSYSFPRDLLGHYFPYFATCFNGHFKEGVSGILPLPDDKPEFIELISYWVRDGHASLTSDLFKEPHRASFELLLLPDKYDFPNLVVTVERFLDLKDRGENSLVVHAVVKAVELDLLVESLQPLPLESPLLKNLASSCLRVLDAKRGYADVIPVRALMKASDQLALAAMRLMLSSSYYDNFGERIGDKNGYRVQGSREAR